MTPNQETAQPLDVRLRLSALWATTMVIVAFVDIFAFYRADVREQIDSGQVLSFDIGQGFMIGIIVYVLIPTLMIAACILLPRRANQRANLAVASVFAVTIVGAAIGEWAYYLLASAVELALLVLIFRITWKWRRATKPKRDARVATAG